MVDKKEERDRDKGIEPRKLKEVCCEKYLKKGKRCKSCPGTAAPVLPPELGLPVNKQEDK